MKTKSLWKRIFGQPDKKVRAQAAFQEQFETKLQFRELEPRVVLAADATFDSNDNFLNIDINDGDSITIGEDANGDLWLTGLDSLKIDDVDQALGGGGKFTFTGVSSFGKFDVEAVGVLSDALESSVVFDASLTGNLTVVGGGTSFISNIDSVIFEQDGHVKLQDHLTILSPSSNDDSSIQIDGSVDAISMFVRNNGDKSVTFSSSETGSFQVDIIEFEVGGQGAMAVDLWAGVHDVEGFRGHADPGGQLNVAIADQTDVVIREFSGGSSLNVSAGGNITDLGGIGNAIEVSGTAEFNGASVVLDSVTAGHDFQQVTINTTGGATIVDSIDGFDFIGTNNVQGDLILTVNGSISQTGGTLIVSGTTNVTVSGGALVNLNQSGNEIGGAVSVNSGTARAGLVHIFDNTGDLVLGDIHATDLIADSQGAILQDVAGLDILQTTALVAGDGSNITLNSSNNVLGGSISAEGQTGAAGAVSIHNTMATALASVHGATLTVHSEGAIQQQSGTIQATTASLNVASGAAITLDKLNQIGTILAEGAAGSAAGDVVIMNNGSLALDTIHANSLTVTLQNAGDLSNTATSDITVSGLTTLTATNILLGENLGNAHDFGTVTLTTAGNATLLDSSGDLTFVGDSHVGGNLVAAASAGSVLQSGGKLEIDGTSHFTAKSGAFVTLDESDNVFGGSLSASVGATGTVTIATGSDLKLGTIATGTFAATATNSNITDTFGQSITVASLATLSGKSVVLGEPGHDLLEVTLTATASSEIVETNGFAFVGNSTIGDDLTVTSGGAIVDTTTTKISVADEAWFTGGLITLNQSNDKHAFSSLRLTTAGVADIVEFDGFSFFGNTSVGNNLSVASGGAILQSDGKIAVAGESAFHAAGAISLTSLLNDFNSNGDAIGSVSATGTAVDLVDTNSIILGDIDAQNLSVTASAGSITQTGPTDKIVVATNSQFTATGEIQLSNATNDFTGAINATGMAIELADANSVLLGDIDAQNLSVTAAAGSITQTGPADKILVANESHFTATGAITLANITNDFTGSVSAAGAAVDLVDTNSIILGDIDAQSLVVAASAGSITQTGPGDKILVANESHFTATGAITLANITNDFTGPVSAAGTAVELVDANSILLGNINAQSFSVTATAGSITQTGPADKIAVATTSHFTATGAITLANIANDFTGSVSATGTAVELVDANSIVLGDIDAQSLVVTAAAGSITQTGPADKIAVATTSHFTATGAIILANNTNDFTGSVSATGTAVELVDANSIILGDIDVQSLVVTAAAGSITQTGPADKIAVANESHFTATGAITLANNTNDFTGAVSAAGTAVELADANSVLLGDIDAQNLSVAAVAGSITQTGPADKIAVANESHFTATGAITLANNTNDFTGSVSAAGTAVELVDANSIILGDIDVQSLSVTASAGSITQTGPADKILVANESHFTATGAITLANNTNDFTGSVSAAGTAVELVDANSIILGDIDVQSLAVTAAAGSITQTGPADKIAVATTSHFTATGAITLANIANDFTGAVSATGTAVELVDANSIVLGDIDAQSLVVTAAAGSITQTGPADKIAVANESHFTATGAITLANNTNDFTGSVSAAGTAVELVDANSIILGDIDVQSLVVTAAAGSITQTAPADNILVVNESQFTATGEILLGNATNDFMGFVNATGTAIELSDANSIILGNINAQSLSVTATAGSITQTGPADKILVANNSQFTATGGITLLNSTNDFNDDGDGNGSVAATGTDVAIRDVNSISLGEISAASFQVVAGGDVTQSSSGEKLTVTGKTDIHLTGAGSVDLQYGANKLTDTVTLKLDDIAHLQNFHLRNEDASATTPSGDLAEALAIGNVINLSFLFPVAGSLVLAEDPDGGGFDEIDILGDLYVELGGSLTQKGSIYVDGSAHFQAGTINLAQTGNLDVDFDASFKATAGDIQVGVTTEAREAFIRGADSGQTVNFGTLSFEAAGYDVTIAEDSKVDLVGQNKAQSLVLASTTAGIADSAATSLTVSDLASFKADVGNIILQQGVDLRIVYASAKGDVAIVDSSLSDGLNIVDGTTADGGTLAIESNGHILQINDFRMGAPVDAQIVADSAIFHSDGSVLLTDLKVSHLAGAAGAAINVSVNEADIVSNALVNKQDGFGTILEIDAIDQLLPVAAGDPFAPQGPNPARAISGDYSFIAVNNGSLTIENVAGVGDVANHLGIKAEGQGAGHVFLRAKGAGANLDFKGSAGKENVIDLANSGILTALAEGELSIAANTELISRTGNVDGIVREIYKFEEQVNSGNNPELGGGFGIVDDISFGPTYIRELASKDADHQDPNTTLFLRIVNGIDTKANVTLTQLGIDGEQDLQVTVNWGDETETFLFSDAIANEKLSHFFSDDFLALNPVFTVTVTAYNSPLINLYENVESGNGSPRSLNVIQDQILMKVIIAEIWVPEVTEFVPPTNPIPQMAPIVTYTVSQVTTQVEFTDDTRVATPIDGVSVVEVNRNDPDMAIGDEVQLGDEFMTLDAVKEQIQRDERFRPGLYRITILYPGVETPQVFLFEKQIRATPIDIFGSNTPRQPQRPQVDQVAEAAQNAATAEEVWAREYEKWFPTVAIEYAGEDNVPEDAEGRVPADERQGQISPDAEVLLERVSLLDLQEVERLSERLRAQRSIVRDSLNGALVGGAALMAAAAVQRRGDEAHSVVGEEPPHEVRGGSLGRLQRRLRQWL